MEILGIGMPELMFILVIALIVLGPKDMEKAGKTVGKWLRGIVTSDGWKVFQQTSREVRNLPTRLIREANDEIGKINNDMNNAIGGTKPAAYSTPSSSRPVQQSVPAQESKVETDPQPSQQSSIEETLKPDA